jgi:hypothetical protein
LLVLKRVHGLPDLAFEEEEKTWLSLIRLDDDLILLGFHKLEMKS